MSTLVNGDFVGLVIFGIVIIGGAIFLVAKCFYLLSAKITQGKKTMKMDQDCESAKSSATMIEIPYVPLSISGMVVPVLWATGSQYSYISLSCAKQLFPSTQILPTNERAKSMNGNPFKFIGEVQCTVKIGSYKFLHTFLVSPDDHCTAKALLGYDFMTILGTRRIKSYLCTLTGTLTIGKDVIALCTKDGRPYQSTASGKNTFEFPSLYSVR